MQKQEKRREDDGKHCAIHHRKTVNPMFFLMGVICVPLYRRIFNRKRHSFHMKRNALRIPQSGNQERIIAYFLENDGQYIRDLAIRSLSEHFYCNYFAVYSLESYITELDDNIRRWKEDEAGYIKKSLTWFRLFYNFQERDVVELRM
ncbi:hypothetical protein [Enterocloster clostridioformis]|nr:hypothetical protein [Enterocloster clostridioformis]